MEDKTLLLQRCALRKFLVTDGRNTRIRLRVIEGPNARDQTALCAFHSFLVEVQKNAGYTDICDTFVITTWRLELQAPLVSRE